MNEENFNRFLLGFIPSPFSISFYVDRLTSGKSRDMEESKVNLKLFLTLFDQLPPKREYRMSYIDSPNGSSLRRNFSHPSYTFNQTVKLLKYLRKLRNTYCGETFSQSSSNDIIIAIFNHR